LVAGDIDQGDTVGGLVGADIVIVVVRLVLLQDRIAMRVQFRGSGDGSAADGDVDGLAVGADMNSSRPLAHRDRRDDGVGVTIDHRYVVRFLVGDVHLIGCGGTHGVRGTPEADRSQDLQADDGWYSHTLAHL